MSELNRLLNSFRKAADYQKSPPFKKLLTHPLTISHSALLAQWSKWSKSPLGKQAQLFWGARMQVYYPEVVSTAIHRYGVYEPGLTWVFLQRVCRAMTVFDVGAHFGYFTLLASHLVGAEGRVHSFEPTPSTAEVLRRNASKCANVVVNNLAVYSEEKEIEFRDFGLGFSAFNTAGTGRLDDVTGGSLQPVTRRVRATTLDGYIVASNAQPDFVKLDAENAEYEILLGAQSLLTKGRPMITLEVGVENAGHGERSPIAHLIAHQYQPMEFDAMAGKLIPHVWSPERRYAYDNLLFVPKEKLSSL